MKSERKRSLLITIAVLAGILLAAAGGYALLSGDNGPNNLVPASTPNATQTPGGRDRAHNGNRFHRTGCAGQCSIAVGLHRRAHRAQFLGELVRPMPDGDARVPIRIRNKRIHRVHDGESHRRRAGNAGFRPAVSGRKTRIRSRYILTRRWTPPAPTRLHPSPQRISSTRRGISLTVARGTLDASTLAEGIGMIQGGGED